MRCPTHSKFRFRVPYPPPYGSAPAHALYSVPWAESHDSITPNLRYRAAFSKRALSGFLQGQGPRDSGQVGGGSQGFEAGSRKQAFHPLAGADLQNGKAGRRQ